MADVRTIATSVDEYEPSLWNFIGQDRARIALMALVDQYFNDRMMGRNPRFPGIMLIGDYGRGRTALARAVHHAMGNFLFKQPGNTLGISEDPADFFQNTTEHTSFYIPNCSSMNPTVIGNLIYIVRDGMCFKSFPNPITETIQVGNRLIIFSAGRNDKLDQDLLRHLTQLIELCPYTNQNIYDILRQRTAGLNWTATDASLRLITQNADNIPGRAMKILHLSHSVARANHKDSIDITHTKQAIEVGFTL